MTAMRIAITGATGFLGKAVVAAAGAAGHRPVGLVRRMPTNDASFDCRITGDLAGPVDWPSLLADVDVVINCAAQVRGASPKSRDDAAAYHAINVAMPLRLAEAAREAGVKRFVQLSSLAAIGATSPAGQLWNDDTPARPVSAYGQSKLAADEALVEQSDALMPIVSLRPPTLFGPGVAGPFAALLKLARRGLPLPVGRIHNRRNMAYVGNVADAVVAAASSVAEGTFIVVDHPPISTADMYRRLLAAFGHRDRVWDWPRPLIEALTAPIGARAHSLIGNAAGDGDRFAAAVGWRPQVSLDEAIALTVSAYR